MIAVHPAYWRRGHATSLVEWATQLADIDNIPLGVDAAPMSVSIMKRAGFAEKETVLVPGYDRHPQPIRTWIGLRPSSKS